MRAYVMTSGAIFCLIVLAHLLRIVAKGPRLATEPDFVLTTLAAVALSAWAFRVLRVTPRS